jgi:hypothetical protein
MLNTTTDKFNELCKLYKTTGIDIINNNSILLHNNDYIRQTELIKKIPQWWKPLYKRLLTIIIVGAILSFLLSPVSLVAIVACLILENVILNKDLTSKAGPLIQYMIEKSAERIKSQADINFINKYWDCYKSTENNLLYSKQNAVICCITSTLLFACTIYCAELIVFPIVLGVLIIGHVVNLQKHITSNNDSYDKALQTINQEFYQRQNPLSNEDPKKDPEKEAKIASEMITTQSTSHTEFVTTPQTSQTGNIQDRD